MQARYILPFSLLMLVTIRLHAQSADPIDNSTKSQAILAVSTSESSSTTAVSSSGTPLESLPDAPQAQSSQPSTDAGNTQPAASNSPHQTKRILFIIPNFRSVTADEKLPPTTTRQKFKLTLEDSFDYSAFVETAILAGMGEAQTSEPQFHGGWAGYGRYYWHDFADLTAGNLMTEFVFPVATREDPRYYTLGHGGFLKRSVYSVSRLVITRNNEGNNTANISEVLGNGTASAISSLYYPSADRTWTKVGQRWVQQIAIDGLSNVVKEFWPEVNRALFHGKY